MKLKEWIKKPVNINLSVLLADAAALFAVIIKIYAVIARAVYSSENSKRLLAYRIITGIRFFIELPASLAGAVILADSWCVIAAVIFGIASAAAFIIGIINTYSDRI